MMKTRDDLERVIAFSDKHLYFSDRKRKIISNEFSDSLYGYFVEKIIDKIEVIETDGLIKIYSVPVRFEIEIHEFNNKDHTKRVWIDAFKIIDVSVI